MPKISAVFAHHAEMDGGGLSPVGAGMVVLVILDKFVTELGVRLDIIRNPTSHGAVEAINNGVFDTIILGINGGREQIIDFAPTFFRFDFVCVVVKNFKSDERVSEQNSGVASHKWKLTPYKNRTFSKFKGTDNKALWWSRSSAG